MTWMTWDQVGSIYIVGRDRTHRIVLLGGLGQFGIGQMWRTELPHYAEQYGDEWTNAPEIQAPPDEIEMAEYVRAKHPRWFP